MAFAMPFQGIKLLKFKIKKLKLELQN